MSKVFHRKEKREGWEPRSSELAILRCGNKKWVEISENAAQTQPSYAGLYFIAKGRGLEMLLA